MAAKTTTSSLRKALLQMDNAASNLHGANFNLYSPERTAKQVLLSLRNALEHGGMYAPQLKATVTEFLSALNLDGPVGNGK